MASPFPAGSRVALSMRAGEVEVRAQGAVRIMHPDKGMGVEFTQATPEHRAAVEKFLGLLNENRALTPELLVEPEGLESEPNVGKPPAEADDPLLHLFYGETLTAEQFREMLQKQRMSPSPMASSASAAAHT
jgi:hypothetical protein